MSEEINDVSAGFNGGFEISQNDLPVNWLVYSPKTVKNGDFKIIMDKNDFKEGKQSLKFEVKICSSLGGRLSPGIAKQMTVTPSQDCTLSFWIKNSGSEFYVSAGGVSPKTGNVKSLLSTDEQIDEWKFYEFDVTVEKEYKSLRIEIGVVQPGTFWIDDIKLEEL